jgi:membrane protease YdiL (CAAX protease family)
MPLLALIILVVGVIIAANLITAANNRRLTLLFDLLLLAGNVLLMLSGVGFSMAPPDVTALMEESGLAGLNVQGMGIAFAGMGLWGIIASLLPVRRLLARLFPALRPDSAVHTLALLGSGYLIGAALLQLAAGGLESLAELAVSATVYDVVGQQLLFVLAAFFGAGLLIRRNSEQLNRRLGLERPTWSQLLVGVRWMILFVILQAFIGAIWALLDPEQAEVLGELNESLLGNFDTVWEWLALAVAAGLGEELLFRGALQPILGLWATAAVFSVAHLQYGFTPATLVVFLLGLVLGIIRQRSNTTVAIFVHAGYNFILGLLSLLATYLQPLAGG